jgi:hypothetical protein
MIRNYLTPEFQYTPVFGTLNMEEESSFFGSKMLEIEDSIQVGKGSIVYYQNQNNEQVNLEKELDFPTVVYDITEDKKNNHSIRLDEFQTQFEKNNLAKWILSIDIKNIFRNYLFATLKQNRTFEGVLNNMTYNRNVDFTIKDYIERNVLNKYNFSSLDFYIYPVDLLTVGGLKYSTQMDSSITTEQFKLNKLSTVADSNFENIKVSFSQEFSASQYSFRYYFNLNYDKI